MKINNLTWKDRVWVAGLLVAGLFVLGIFTYQAVVNANITLVDTNRNLIIPIESFK